MNKTFSQMFKEYICGAGLQGKERAEFGLICRYYNKVSKRLKDRKVVLFEQGMVGLGELYSKPSPLFEILKKDASVGNNYCQPVILGKEHGIVFIDHGKEN